MKTLAQNLYKVTLTNKAMRTTADMSPVLRTVVPGHS